MSRLVNSGVGFITLVSLGADYRLRLDDIPKLQVLLTYGHFPRTTLHSISIATASAKFPAESQSTRIA